MQQAIDARFREALGMSSALRSFFRDLTVTRTLYRALADLMFHRYFTALAATTEELRSEVFRIRYDVYCAELGFEDPKRYPDGREIDDYDRFAYHCLLRHNTSRVYAGCVRLVCTDPNAVDSPLPFERLYQGRVDTGLLASLVSDRTKIGEISRLAVRSSYRRRQGEQSTPGGIVQERPSGGFGPGVRTPWIALGLYFSAAAIGLINGLTGVFALMEPRLARRLRTYGLNFVQVAEPVEHRGMRAPYYISRQDLFTGVPPMLKGLLEVIERDLRSSGAESIKLPRPV
jgi:N-acyl amino acid synthase of PEP-CTERM/exosortase system